MAKAISPDSVFVYCDRDGDGRLTKEEFLRALRTAGAVPTNEDLEEVCRSFSSTPDLASFRAALEELRPRRPTPKVLAERLGGLAQDGLVDADALCFITTNFGEILKEDE
ncbi:unnamed protein product, partial [Polarella glacialis]